MSFRVHALMSRAGYDNVARVILGLTRGQTAKMTVAQDRRPANLTLSAAVKTEPAGRFEQEAARYQFQLAITPRQNGSIDFLAVLDGAENKFSLLAGARALAQGLFKREFQVPNSWTSDMKPRTLRSMERNQFAFYASRLTSDCLDLYLYRFCGHEAPTDHAPAYAPLNLVPVK